MTKFKKKTCFSFAHSRRRQMAANDRKFYIMWINKMVNKQVEKHNTELRAEFSLLSQELREQMAAEIKKQLKEPVAEEAREHSQHYTMLYREEDDEEKSLDQITLSSNSSETHLYTNNIYKKLTKSKTDSLRVLLEDLKDSDSRDTAFTDNKTIQGSADAHRSLQQAGKQLVERHWTEWTDNKEKTGNVPNPHDQQNSQKQGGARPCEPEKPMKQITKVGPANTVKKIRTYISDFFYPHRHYMWKKLEEDD